MVHKLDGPADRKSWKCQWLNNPFDFTSLQNLGIEIKMAWPAEVKQKPVGSFLFMY